VNWFTLVSETADALKSVVLLPFLRGVGSGGFAGSITLLG
jgi:hypothetical protein